MVDVEKDGLINWEIERELSGRSLVCKIRKDKLEEYQVKMIQNNEISSLIKPQIEIYNDIVTLKYLINGRQRLSEYAKQNYIDVKDLKSLIKAIVEIAAISNEYLLCEGGFLIDGNMILVDYGNLEWAFIYIPSLFSKTDSVTQIKAFLQELFKYVHKNDEQTISLLHRLKMIMEEDPSNVLSMKRAISFEENSILVKDKRIENLEYIETKEDKKPFLGNLFLKKHPSKEKLNRPKWTWNQ